MSAQNSHASRQPVACTYRHLSLNAHTDTQTHVTHTCTLIQHFTLTQHLEWLPSATLCRRTHFSACARLTQILINALALRDDYRLFINALLVARTYRSLARRLCVSVSRRGIVLYLVVFSLVAAAAVVGSSPQSMAKVVDSQMGQYCDRRRSICAIKIYAISVRIYIYI